MTFSMGLVNSSPSIFQVTCFEIDKNRNKVKIDFKESNLVFRAI